jgi:hypothetical protein
VVNSPALGIPSVGRAQKLPIVENLDREGDIVGWLFGGYMILDFCWPQSASTAELQPFIFNKAAEVSASKETVSGTGLSALKAAPKTMSSKGGAQADLDEH